MLQRKEDAVLQTCGSCGNAKFKRRTREGTSLYKCKYQDGLVERTTLCPFNESRWKPPREKRINKREEQKRKKTAKATKKQRKNNSKKHRIRSQKRYTNLKNPPHPRC